MSRAGRVSAFALLVFLTRASFAQDDFHQHNGNTCGMVGTATSAAGKDLNRHKDRWTPPNEDQIDAEVSLSAMVAPGNDINRFNEEKGATIRGYVVDVKKGGKETCNCGASDPPDMDTHIEVALAVDAEEIERVIVEVTPRIRAQMSKQHVNWSTQNLNKMFKGKSVEVTGWLTFDSMHVDAAENTNPGGSRNWRATCWEIHPVTAIRTLTPDEQPSLPKIAKAEVSKISGAHRQHVKLSAKAQAAIKARNDKILSAFDKDELEEKEEELRERGH